MKYKSVIIKTVSVFLAVTVILCVMLFIRDRQQPYQATEKTFISMDTLVTEKIYDEKSSGTHIAAVKDIVTGLEDIISRFESESAVSLLNGGERVTEPALLLAVSSVKNVINESGGVFDITVGGLSDLWNIGKEDARVPSEKEIKKELEKIGYEQIKTDGAAIYLDGEGTVDLGAVGKGFACDLIWNYLSERQVKGAVVSVGGSIVAYGDNNKMGDKWNIAIRHPRNENEFLGIVRLDEGFVSTSGDYERYFEQDGKRYHHIFDLRTGYPASSGLISVTVVAETGILSDALSTACLILGEQEGTDLLEKFGASGIFVDENMNVTTVGDIDFEKQ